MSLGTWLVASAIVGVSALIHGGVGIGFPIVAAPLLALLSRDFVPGPTIAVAAAVTVTLAVRESGSIDRSTIRWALLGALPGSIAGAFTVANLPERGLTILFALVLLGAIALTVLGLEISLRPVTLAGAGLAAAFMGTTTAVGGPAIAVVYQRAPGPVIRGTLNLFFAALSAFGLTSLTLVGEFGGSDAAMALALVPGAVAGLLVSRRLAAVIDAGRVRAAVLVVAASAAVVAVIQVLV